MSGSPGTGLRAVTRAAPHGLRTVRAALLTVCLALIGTACSSVPEADDHTDRSDPTGDTALRVSDLVPHNVRARLDDGTLLLAYQLDGRDVYVSTHLTTAADAETPPQLPGRLRIQRLESSDAATWQRHASDALPLAVLSMERWQWLLDETMTRLLDEHDGTGIVVDILLVEELFVYRDETGRVRTVPIEYKPAGEPVAASYGFGELLERAGTHLRGLRGNADLDGSRMLLETGDVAEFGYPFVYADTVSGAFHFLRDDSVARPATGSPLTATLQALLHSLTSQVKTTTNSPISSLARLLTTVTSTSIEFIRPTPPLALAGASSPEISGAQGMDLQAWERHLDEITGETTTSGRLGYLVDGQAFFARLFETINAATESVDLRLYIFDNDDFAKRFADLLRRRSSDIAIRVLLDGLGTLGAAHATSASLPPGYTPPRSIISYLRRDSGIRVRKLSNPWLLGDHTKSIVIDGSTAFIGGMNIGREYRYDWHDLMIEVDGPVVGLIEDDFEKSWKGEGLLGDLQRLLHLRRGEHEPTTADHYPVRALYTRPGDAQILRAQVAAIRTARQRIYIENAYLTSDALVYELVKARRRGVDVRVIMPLRGDNGLINRSNVLTANAMLRHGIRVYIYPRMSHVKAAVYDGWACFGSANFDNLSLHINKELNLATSHPAAVEALVEQLFVPDMAASLELSEPLPRNWGDHLAELLADFL